MHSDIGLMPASDNVARHCRHCQVRTFDRTCWTSVTRVTVKRCLHGRTCTAYMYGVHVRRTGVRRTCALV